MAFRERILGLVRGSINAKGQLTHDPVRSKAEPHSAPAQHAYPRGHPALASLVAHPCAACAQSHPIFNFIFQYYFIEKRILLRWTPGPGVLVRGAAPVEPLLWQGRGWQAHADGGHYDPRQLHSGKPGRLNGLRRARDILRRTAERAAHLNCFGMHEWAMLYQPDGERAPPRHQQLPLRLEQAALTLTLTLALTLTLPLTLALTLTLTLTLTRAAGAGRAQPRGRRDAHRVHALRRLPLLRAQREP